MLSKTRLIDESLKIFLEPLPKKAHKNAEVFFRQFYAHFNHEDMHPFTPISLSQTFMSLWELIQNREPDQAKYRIYRWKPGKQEHQSERLIIDIVNKNMPFLVDSLTELLQRHKLHAHILVHPIVCVERDTSNNLVTIQPSKNRDTHKNNLESIIHCEVKEALTSTQLRALEKDIPRILGDIHWATRDWQLMRKKALETLEVIQRFPHLEEYTQSELIEFIQWLEDRHFTFLGYCEYVFPKRSKSIGNVVPGTPLGILKNKAFQSLESIFEGIEKMPEGKEHLFQPTPLTINKSSQISKVHRSVPMDTIAIRELDATGAVSKLYLFIGLFTSEAYDSSPRDIPFLRQKVKNIVKRAGFDSAWHDGKALLHILDSLPRDELFEADEEELAEIGLTTLNIQSRQRLVMFMRKDHFNRYLSCLVYIPRDRFDYELCEQIKALIAQDLNSSVTLMKAQFGSFSLALVHYHIHLTPHSNLKYNQGLLEQKLMEAARSWRDELRFVIDTKLNEWESAPLIKRYGKAFSKSYEDNFDAHEAYLDIIEIEKLLLEKKKGSRVYRPDDYENTRLKLKIYNPGRPLALSEILPTLENLDLKVLTEIPFEVKPTDLNSSFWIHDFDLESRGNCPIDMEVAQTKFRETLLRIWSGETKDGSFNRLVIRAGLDWRQCMMFLAYSAYLRQIGTHFSEGYLSNALIHNPGITRLLSDLFQSRFSPETPSSEGEERLSKAIEQALVHVINPDDDRILRHFRNLIQSTIRTNYFQPQENGIPKPYISFKIESAKVEELPLPKPLYEIFVFSPDMEAIHLRGGKVARGGIRWSDRMQDYRTEVLGLMKAQMVKNTVIVPVGSKGGFIVKKSLMELPRGQQIAEVVTCYKTMMRGLLDITDNLVKGKVVPPKHVVRHDDDDPYLVVAADKGTATFSDYANSVSQEYNFWLQDAFASGGSAGYDHKKMAITARGAWESVRQHFRSMNINVDNEEITVVGIGDMSGDVFGNGLLLSQHLKLLAAFNHMHIFVDPSPDSTTSFKERQRLFKLPKSTWADYNPSLISKGGGVFERKARILEISPQIKELFHLTRANVTPQELIQAILKANVDLIWFGGIGTYVKAKSESHADVADHVNNSVRVNASDLHAKVIGEGANLGVTQLGRIEFAQGGGHINTDAIDNSAGVDTSDHEVNIKILLNQLIAENKMSLKIRDNLLKEMSKDVAFLVLRDNQLQNQAISLIASQGMALADQQGNFMRALEKQGLLNRDIEYLPDDATLAEYQEKNIALSRPEIAILLSYAKLKLYADILESKLIDHPYFESCLIEYFPNIIQQKYKKSILTHPLKREIIATIAVNMLVNQMGPSFVNEVIEKSGASVSDVFKAYFIVQEIFGLKDLWMRAENLYERISMDNQLTVMISLWKLARRAVLWMLRSHPGKLDLVKTTDTFLKGVSTLSTCLEAALDPESQASLQTSFQHYLHLGLPKDFAYKLASLGIMTTFPDIILIAEKVRYAVQDTAHIYFLVGDYFGFNYLRNGIELLKSSGSWQRLALTSLTEDLYNYQDRLCIEVLKQGKGKRLSAHNKGELLKHWIDSNPSGVARIEKLLTMIKATRVTDLAQLMVISRELRILSGD